MAFFLFFLSSSPSSTVFFSLLFSFLILLEILLLCLHISSDVVKAVGHLPIATILQIVSDIVLIKFNHYVCFISRILFSLFCFGFSGAATLSLIIVTDKREPSKLSEWSKSCIVTDTFEWEIGEKCSKQRRKKKWEMTKV